MEFVVELNDKGIPIHNNLLLFPQGCTLTILRPLPRNDVGSMLFSTTYPDDRIDKSSHSGQLPMDFNMEHGEFSISLVLRVGGPFSMTTSFISDREKENDEPVEGPMIRFFVMNEIRIGNERVGHSGLCIQSNISNSLGAISEWSRSLVDAYLCGYNCIHLTPVQVTGASGSCFSIHDFLDVDPRFFTGSEPLASVVPFLDSLTWISPSGKEHYSFLFHTLQSLRNQYRFAFVTDIVLNHISFDSPLLSSHLDISYNNRNTPQLIPAIELDTLLSQMTESLCDEGVTIATEKDVDAVIRRIHDALIEARFEEYWLINPETLYRDVSSVFSITACSATLNQSETQFVTEKELRQAIQHSLYEAHVGHRFPFTVDIPSMKEFLSKRTISQSTVLSVVEELNAVLHKQLVEPVLSSILQSLRRTIRYRFLETVPLSSVPCRGYPLVENYFTMIREVGVVECDGVGGVVENSPTGNAADDKLAKNTTDKPAEYTTDKPSDNSTDNPIDNTTDDNPSQTIPNHTTNQRRNSYHALVSTEDADGAPQSVFCANNGWTWNSNQDPLNLQQATSRNYLFRKNSLHCTIESAYLLREVVVWSDCVKLRYFDGEQNTWIFGVMEEYVRLSALLFDGFRLDNCHNTSIRLLEVLIASARAVNPSLFILAELFTSNQNTDVEYIRRVGIDMIVRETARDPREYENTRRYSDVLYVAGGEELGSLQTIPGIPRSLTDTRLPVVLYDLTHDNKSFLSLYGLASIPAVTVMASMAVAHVASTKGQDEGFVINPSVTETRHYLRENDALASYSPDALAALLSSILYSAPPSCVSLSGNMHLRLLMNRLHQLLSREAFVERYVHSYDDVRWISVERRHPSSNYSVLSVTNTAFSMHPTGAKDIRIIGRVEGVFVSVRCLSSCYSVDRAEEEWMWNQREELKGTAFSTELHTDRLHPFCTVESVSQNAESILHFSDAFTPGCSIVLLLYTGHASSASHLLSYCECCEVIASTRERIRLLPSHPDDAVATIALAIRQLDPLPYDDLSYALFTSQEEEQALNHSGVYEVPFDSAIQRWMDSKTGTFFQHHNRYGMGPLVYAGLYGVIPAVKQIVRFNVLNHPLLENVRQGNWLVDYLLRRLERRPSLRWLWNPLRTEFEFIKQCPRNTRPFHFCHLMHQLDQAFVREIGIRLGAPPNSAILCRLAMASLQFTERLPQDTSISILAGIPHFTTGIMRNWGRDTFIAAPGILLSTHRLPEAKALILRYAAVARHGLICNLFADGEAPRFNSRDATWWWLHVSLVSPNDECVMLYEEQAKSSESLLQASVTMKFLDGSPERTVEEIIQWMLQSLATGIDFDEWGAPAIDEHMTPEGFHVHVAVNDRTGFVEGGNKWNCGTWMDKMGSYDDGKHSNAGKPATPRDGSAIELVALQYSVLCWLDRLHRENRYRWEGVDRKDQSLWTFHDWASTIREHFESCFFLEEKGLYKDTYHESMESEDLETRPNFMIAMGIAPALFDHEHAVNALQSGIASLYGAPSQLGVKTLAASDPHYRCYYDNQMCFQGDIEVCSGFSYHNGPEWLWPTGFIMEALKTFHPPWMNSATLLRYQCSLLYDQFRYFCNDDWMSLPEMTNHDGEYNAFSCRAQAWSVGCLLNCVFQLK